ncbi:MAG: glycosyltransferase family 4 protein [Gemmatimonadales bacterium]
MRLCLAANASPWQGGQGVNLAHMAAAADHIARDCEFFAAHCTGLAACRTVPQPRIARLLRMRGLRRWRDGITTVESRWFDRWVAKRLSECDVFHGITGQCRDSLAAAERLGAMRVLDSITHHIGELGRVLDETCRGSGVRVPISGGLRRVMRQEYETADVIRVMSHVSRQSFLDRGVAPEKLHVLPPFIDCSAIDVRQAPPETFTVSFAGLVEPWKGVGEFVSVSLHPLMAQHRFIIWGGLGSRAAGRLIDGALRQGVDLQVKPVGIREAGYPNVYGRSSVLLHLAHADGFGLTVLEAMATGVPVIVSEHAGAADLVRDGENGYVVRPSDIDGIAERLAELAVDPDLNHRMGREARTTAERYDFDRFVSGYRAMLDRGRSGG